MFSSVNKKNNIDGQKKIRVERLWTAAFILSCIINLLVQTISNMTNTTVTTYVNYIGAKNSIAGFAVTAFTIAALLMRPVAGRLIDKKGRKITLVLGGIIVVLACIMYSFTYSIVLLLLVRFLHGVGFSLNTTSTSTIVADQVPRTRLSEGLGIFTLSATISSAVGPALGMFIIEGSGYNLLFVSMSILSVIALVCTFGLNYERQNTISALHTYTSPLPEEINAKKREGYFERSIYPVSLVMIINALILASILSFLYLHASNRGIANIGLFFTISACAMFATRLFAGRLADRLGYTIVIIPGMIFTIIAMVLISFAYSLPVLLAAALLYGLGMGVNQPILYAIVIRVAPIHRRGAASATYWASLDIGVGAGSMLWGFVSQFAGFTMVYLLSAFCGMLSIIAYYFLVHKKMLRNSGHMYEEDNSHANCKYKLDT